MATDKPRITITLEPEQHAVLRRLADLQGGSMSRIVSEFLGEVTPILEKVADSLDLAKRASADARAKFVQSAQKAEEELRPLAEFTKSQFDLFASEIERLVQQGDAPADGVQATEERGAVEKGAVRRKGASPRPVITGATDVQRGVTKPRRKTSSGASLRAK